MMQSIICTDIHGHLLKMPSSPLLLSKDVLKLEPKQTFSCDRQSATTMCGTLFQVMQTEKKIRKISSTTPSFYQFIEQLIGEGNGTPLQYSCLENPMDRGAWQAAAHGVARSRTRLSDFTFTFHFHALEKEMATHSSVLAWRIPGTAGPGGLPSMGLHRVGQD